jgi:hypothetical protein
MSTQTSGADAGVDRRQFLGRGGAAGATPTLPEPLGEFHSFKG